MSLRNASWLVWAVLSTLICAGLSVIGLVAIHINDNDTTELRVPSKCENTTNPVCDQPLVVYVTTNCRRSELTIEIYNLNAAPAHYDFVYDDTSKQGTVQPGWSTVASASVSQGSHSIIFNIEGIQPVRHDFSC